MLVRFALRTAALMALSDRTFMRGNIFDSRIGAIDVSADGTLKLNEDRPFAVIFTDDSTADDGRRHAGLTAFVIEAGIAQPNLVIDEATGESRFDPDMDPTTAGLPATDDVLEFALDLLDRQVAMVLADPTNEWSEIWRRLHDGVVRTERRRISREDRDVRRAARQIRMMLDAKPDPTRGPLSDGSVWREMRALLERGDADRLAMFDLMLTLPSATSGDLTFAQARAAYMMTVGRARALRVAPYDDAAPDAAIAEHEATRHDGTITWGGGEHGSG